MADLCGPSNALQNFQKNSAVDRTLQQDRLSSRNVPSQGFRSAGPSNRIIDSEFEAFQAGQMPLPQPHSEAMMGIPQSGFPDPLHAPLLMQQPSSAAWANDFQRLQLSSPSAASHQHSFIRQGQQPQLNGTSQQFVQKWNQPVSSTQSPLGYNAPLERLSMTAFQEPLSYSNFMSPTSMPNKAQQQSQADPVEAFDEDAFARAFDQAAASELEQAYSTAPEQEILFDKSAEELLRNDPDIRIGADLIHDPDPATHTDPQAQNDPDALARTAGQLLHSVRDNQSDKFQNSTFLSLMRQLRDKEVAVEGDKIVQVASVAQREGEGESQESKTEPDFKIKRPTTPPLTEEQYLRLSGKLRPAGTRSF